MVWWIGGSDKIAKALEQLGRSSDRAIAIIAAAIMEEHITEAIKRRWQDAPAVIRRMLQTEGPLGNFGPKIDLVFLMGLISPEGHRDMTLIKKVRNKFAHYLDVDDFNTPVIKGWCFDLKHFENFVLTDAEMAGAPKGRKLFGQAGMDERLRTAKGRYITAVQFYSLIFGPEWPGVYMPPIVKPTPLF
jgi:DNA-binding MltR family transcriptional regulator